MHERVGINDSNRESNLITIVSQKNSIGDTAIMMACYLGNSIMLDIIFDQLFTFARWNHDANSSTNSGPTTNNNNKNKNSNHKNNDNDNVYDNDS
jgi:hypothetical protein